MMWGGICDETVPGNPNIAPERQVGFKGARGGTDRTAGIAELGPGDVLYHPAGIWHRVECTEDSLSMNISLISTSWGDHLAEATRHALIEALEKEKDDEKEKQKARVNAGKAALASRQKHRASMQAKGRERAPSASAPSGIPASAPSPPSVPSPEGDEPFMKRTSPTRAPAARETSPDEEQEDLSARRERRAGARGALAKIFQRVLTE